MKARSEGTLILRRDENKVIVGFTFDCRTAVLAHGLYEEAREYFDWGGYLSEFFATVERQDEENEES